MGDDEKTIRVGSRKSELALIQTKHVIGLLQKLFPQKKFEIHTMSTIGDRVLNISLPKIGEKSLFTRDLEDALRNGGVDFVVHSLKDLPTALPTGMAIGAVLEREDARDALVLRESYKDYKLQTLPAGCVIGTSSLRRTAQLRRQYPHLTVCDIRGNLNTRLAKLDAPDSKYSGIILAQAGLVRMGWLDRISQVLEPTDLLYAVGQGALAVECRANDTEILDMLRKLICLPTTCRILAERSFLKTLGGGCSAPVAVVSKLHGAGQLDNREQNNKSNSPKDATSLALEGAVWSLNGAIEIREQITCELIAVDCKKKRTAAGNDEEQQEPVQKRTRQEEENKNSTTTNSPQRKSPPIINDDVLLDNILDTYDLKELIEKHIDLAKKCPVVGVAVPPQTRDFEHEHDNGNKINGVGNKNGNIDYHSGGGDADRDIHAPSGSQHCPLQIDVGQDVMGQCPFVNNDVKVTLAASGICPITSHSLDGKNGNTVANTHTNTNIIHNNEQNADQVDHALPNSPKCPFATEEQKINKSNNNLLIEGTHAKCPFLQKSVKMFDYGDEEQPLPKKLNILIEDVDNLFCGLYQHKCFSRDLFARSHDLGKKLAENLIQKGALDVMKAAQTEIHSKIS